MFRIVNIFKEELGRIGIWAGLAMAIAIGVSAIGYRVVTDQNPPSEGTANIWVDSSGNCTGDSANPVSYSNDGTECTSLSAAYAIAEAGDIIGIRTGSYSADTVAYRSALADLSPGCDPYGEWGSVSTSNCVKVIPDGGNVIWTGDLIIKASSLWLAGTATGTAPNWSGRTYNLILDTGDGSGFSDTPDCNSNCHHGNLRVRGDNTSSVPDHVVAEGVHSHTFVLEGANHVELRDAEVGPNIINATTPGEVSTCDSPQNKITVNGSGGVTTDYVTWERVYNHGHNRTADAALNNACHQGGMISATGTSGLQIGHVRIRDSAYWGNVVHAWLIQMGPSSVNNLLVQNSVFGCGVEDALGDWTVCQNKRMINFDSGTYNDILIRFNSFNDNPVMGSGLSVTNMRVIGNILEEPGDSDPFCTTSGVTRDSNVFLTNRSGTGNNCSSTNSSHNNSPSNIFTTPGTPTSYDLHLLNTTNVANDFVSTGTGDYALTTDFDAQSRPQDTNRDAGADEQNTP